MKFSGGGLHASRTMAGLTRAGFIQALSQYQVSPFQYTAEELRDAD